MTQAECERKLNMQTTKLDSETIHKTHASNHKINGEFIVQVMSLPQQDVYGIQCHAHLGHTFLTLLPPVTLLPHDLDPSLCLARPEHLFEYPCGNDWIPVTICEIKRTHQKQNKVEKHPF